jgi:hypothetical protein
MINTASTMNKKLLIIFVLISMCMTACVSTKAKFAPQMVLPRMTYEFTQSLPEDRKAISDLYSKFKQIPMDEKYASDWLFMGVQLLPTIFVYEYAARMNYMGKQEDAFYFLAYARFRREMDSSACISIDQRSDPDYWIYLTNQIEADMLRTLKGNNKVWVNSIGNVLRNNDRNVNLNWVSPLWLCGVNNIKNQQDANESSRRRFEYLKNDFKKISQTGS